VELAVLRRTIPSQKNNLMEGAKMTDEVLVENDQRGNISILTLTYRPYNLLGPKLINAIIEEIEKARRAGSRAIIIRSGLRHFSAGADLDIFSKRVDQGAATPAAENRKMTGVEFLSFMETLPIPIIASVHGVCLGGGLESHWRATTSLRPNPPKSDP